MTCPEALARADAALEGPLPAPEEEALLAHLASCPACAAEAGEGRRLHASLLALRVEDPGPAFAERVVGALDRGPGGPGRAPGRILRAAVAVVGTAAVSAAALLLLPVEEAAAAVAERVPALSSPVPALAGIADVLPPWAAPAAAGILAVLAIARAARLLPGAR